MSDYHLGKLFLDLTGNNPFPWQIALLKEFISEDFPTPISISTGLGKTSIIALWLISCYIALHEGRSSFPHAEGSNCS